MTTSTVVRAAVCPQSKGFNSSSGAATRSLPQRLRGVRPAHRQVSLQQTGAAAARRGPRCAHRSTGLTVQAAYASEEEPQISPMVPRSDASGMVELQQFLLQSRAIILGGRITDKMATTTVGQLLALEASDSTAPIRVYINSMGGSTYSALGIFDVMRSLKCPISTVGMGLVAGTATVLLAAGTKGERYVMPNTRVMIQQPYGGAMGSVFDVRVQSKELDRQRAVVSSALVELTGRTIDEISLATDRETYLGGQDVVDFGIVDKLAGDWGVEALKGRPFDVYNLGFSTPDMRPVTSAPISPLERK